MSERGISYWNNNTSMTEMMKRHKQRMEELEHVEEEAEERLTGSELLDRLWRR